MLTNTKQPIEPAENGNLVKPVLADVLIWTEDKVHNTLEGRLDKTLLFDIEITGYGVVIYQMKKMAGNFICKNNLEEAKNYCQNVLILEYIG